MSYSRDGKSEHTVPWEKSFREAGIIQVPTVIILRYLNYLKRKQEALQEQSLKSLQAWIHLMLMKCL